MVQRGAAWPLVKLPALLPSAALVCEARGIFLEEKTLLWMLLLTLIMTRLVFLPRIFVTQQDRQGIATPGVAKQ